MFDSVWINDIVQKLNAVIPQGVKQAQQDLQKTFRGIIQSKLAELDLVTREELNVQSELLRKTQAQLDEIQKQLETVRLSLKNQQNLKN